MTSDEHEEKVALDWRKATKSLKLAARIRDGGVISCVLGILHKGTLPIGQAVRNFASPSLLRDCSCVFTSKNISLVRVLIRVCTEYLNTAEIG